MGPGLISGIAGNDAGGITTYSVMGAKTGLSLLWLFPITIVILAVVQEMAARLGVVTGQGLSDLIRDRFGVRWTVFAMVILLIANMANSVAEFSGAAASLEIFGISRYLVVPIVAILIWGLVLFASYRTVERIFLGVALVFVTYIAAAILARPDWGAVGRALVTPQIVATPGILLLMVAVVGTTITPYMQFYLQSAVAEKGIDEEELRLEQADAVGGAIWTNVIAIFIVVATATTIYAAGGSVTSAADAAQALEPVAGRLAELLFAVGLFGASVLAATIMPISTAYVICEAFGWESGVGKRFGDARAFFGIYTLVLVVGHWSCSSRDRPPAGDPRLAEPPGPPAADRARLHGPARQRQAADGPACQRSAAQRDRLGVRRPGRRARRRPARDDRPRCLRHPDRRLIPPTDRTPSPGTDGVAGSTKDEAFRPTADGTMRMRCRSSPTARSWLRARRPRARASTIRRPWGDA